MKNQLRKGVLLGYINMIVNIFISLVYVPLMLKLMGDSEYGLYSLVVSIIGYLSVLDMGFGNAMIRFISKSKAKEELEKERIINGLFLFMYSIIGIIAFIIGIILIMNTNMIFKSLTINELSKAKILMLIMVVTVAVSFPLSIFDSYVIASEKFTFIKILSIIKAIVIPLIMLPLLYNNYKSITMVIVNCSITLIMHILNMIYCFKNLNMKIEFRINKIDKVILKEIINYSVYIFLNIIIDNLYANTDQVILGAVSGTLAVSIYAVAAKISSINQSFSTNISGVFFPKITKCIEEENGTKKVSEIFIKVSRIQLYVMTLILGGFIAFGKQFINLWVGNQYMDAYYIILLLIGPSIIPLTQNIGISIIQALNKHKFRSLVYLIIAILNIAVSIPLSKKFGGIGAAMGTALATTIGQIITMNIFYYKSIKLDIPTYWKNFVCYSGPVIIISLTISCFIKNITLDWISLFIYIIIYILIYILYLYRNLNIEEKKYINCKIKRRIIK